MFCDSWSGPSTAVTVALKYTHCAENRNQMTYGRRNDKREIVSGRGFRLGVLLGDVNAVPSLSE